MAEVVVDGGGDGIGHFAAPLNRFQQLRVLLVADVGELDQHGRHFGRFQNRKSARSIKFWAVLGNRVLARFPASASIPQ